jgi:Ulp1 family protease
VACPQQCNGYDCGIYTILFAKYFAENYSSLDCRETSIGIIEVDCQKLREAVTPEASLQYRNFIIDKIIELAETS